MANRANEEYSLMYDFYGALLTGRQREVFELYHEENFSLSEIAERLSITRQAVHISLRKAREELETYEEKLGLIEKHSKYEEALIEVEKLADNVLKDKARMAALDPQAAKGMRKIKKMIKGLDI